MRIFSSVPDGLAYVFTALIGFAFLVLLYLLFDWLRLRRRMGQMDEQLATAERERARNARNLGSMERQKDILQEQLRKAHVERESLAHRLAETTGLLTAARDELAQRPASVEVRNAEISEIGDHDTTDEIPQSEVESEPQAQAIEEDNTIIQTLTAEPDAARHGLHAQTHEQVQVEQGTAKPQTQEIVVTGLNAELEDMRAFLDQQRRAALQIRSGQETQIAELQTQLQTLKTSYADLQSTVGQYEAQLSKQHAFMAAVPASATELEAKITALNTTLAEAESAVAQEREQTHNTIATLQQQLQAAQAQLAQAQAEMQAVQGRADTFEAQVHDLLTQAGTANSAIIERDALLVERESAIAKRDDALAERDAALAKLDAQLKAALAKSSTIELQATPAQTGNVPDASDAADLRQQLAERESGMLLLNSQVVKLQSRLMHANETLAQLQANGHSVSQTPTWSTLAMAQKEMVMPSEHDREHDADFESAKQIIAQRDARVFELEEALATHRSAAQTAQQDLESAKSLLSLRDAQVSELEERIADLREQTQQHAAEMDVANATLAERIETISELNQELDARDQGEPTTLAAPNNDEIAALKAELAANQQVISQLQEQLQQAKAASTSAKPSAKARQERNAQAAQLAELTIQIHEAQEKIAEKGEAVSALTDKLKAANRELEAAKLKMAEDGDEINVLYARLNALSEEAAAAPEPTPKQSKPKPKSPAWVSAAAEEEADSGDVSDEAEVEVEAATPKPSRVSRTSRTIPAPAPAVTPAEKKKPKVAKSVKSDRGGDDLEGLEGIGPIYAAKLRRAGVHSFKALAKAKPSQIEKIIKPKDWQKIDFAHWIAQAKARAKKSGE